jgi:hypothetical protein
MRRWTMRRLAISLLLSLCCGCAAFCEAFCDSLIESAVDGDDDSDRHHEDRDEPEKKDDTQFERSPEGLNDHRDGVPARTHDSD